MCSSSWVINIGLFFLYNLILLELHIHIYATTMKKKEGYKMRYIYLDRSMDIEKMIEIKVRVVKLNNFSTIAPRRSDATAVSLGFSLYISHSTASIAAHCRPHTENRVKYIA